MLTSIGDVPPAPPGTRIAYSRGEFQFGELRLPSVSVATPIATEATLVAAAKLGDRSAFLELWTRYSNMAFKTAYRIMGNRDDAEDVIPVPEHGSSTEAGSVGNFRSSLIRTPSEGGRG
jgi:hypothetical protein